MCWNWNNAEQLLQKYKTTQIPNNLGLKYDIKKGSKRKGMNTLYIQ